MGATSFGAWVLIKRVVTSSGVYGGSPVASYSREHSPNVCRSDYATGSHTIQLQVRRSNAGDAVTVGER